MSAVPHHQHEFSSQPREQPDDPRNGLLDAFEQFVEALKDNDLGLQARLRFERHFPPAVALTPPPPDTRPELGSAAGDAHSPAGELGLAALITDLRRVERLKLSGLAHKAVAAIKAKAEADLEAVKAARSEEGTAA